VAESRIRNPDAMIVSRHLWSPARILFVCLAFAAWSPETKQHGGGNEKNDWLVSPVSAQVPASTSAPSPSPAGPPAPLRTPQRVVLGTITVQRPTGPGGTPIGNSAAKEWRRRSPLAYLESAPAACRLIANHGIHDGRGKIPCPSPIAARIQSACGPRRSPYGKGDRILYW